jgi:hypothetical protein
MRRFVLLALLAAVSRVAIAQSADVPLNNWTVPPYQGTASTDGALTTMTDVTPGVGFVGVAPCRLVDTRQAGFPPGWGAPALSPGVLRNFDLNSDPQCPGIPAGVDAYSLNVTVTQTGGPGHLVIYPQGGVQPTVSSINYVAGQTIANAVIVPAGTNGGVTVVAGVSATHLIIDINGYFTDEYNAGASFHAVSSAVAPAILAENTSTAANAVALQAVITSTTPGDFATAVFARNNGDGYGVHASSATGFGLIAGGGAGGVWAVTDGGNQNAAVYGNTINTLASWNFGVFGDTRGQASGSAGVRGRVLYTNDSVLARGSLGVSSGSANGSYGVFADGDYGGTGAKYFVEPHPKRPDLVIRYISLEGNEAGTYFRGRGRFQNGLATIDVPEDFRLVTDAENLSVVATPIGGMATISVARIGLDQIVLQGSRNVEFFYIVNGIRRTHKHLTPIGPGREYMPETPDAKMPSYLTDGQKEMLISNGTYRPDGTVNMETARRLGWDKEWKKRERPAPEPASN